MPNEKIVDLPEDTTPAATDFITTVDVSDTSDSPEGSSKKVQIGNLGLAALTPHATTHQNGGSDEISVAGLSGVLADPQVANTLRETSGPTNLATGNILDGELLIRSGGSIVSVPLPEGGSDGVGDVVGPSSATDNALARFDTTTGKLIRNSPVTLDDAGAFTVPEIATPSTPSANKVSIYAKADGKLYIKDDAGTETDLTASSAGIGGSTGATDNRALRADGTGGATTQSSNLSIPDDAATTEVGYLNIPQNPQSTNYTAVLADRGWHLFHPSSDNNPRTFTIPANSSVAYPVGTAITFVNKINVLTIAINTDTLTWAEDGSTGSRTLGANGICTALKITSTEWLISGVGLS